jgi:hypothetical protein
MEINFVPKNAELNLLILNPLYHIITSCPNNF